jgi:PAS domain-containing protein
LYGCETWSFTLREEHGLRVFENRVLRRIFGFMREEGVGGWRTLHDEELHKLYASLNIIRVIKSRRMRWADHVARMKETRNAYTMLVVKPDGEKPVGRPRRWWEYVLEWILGECGEKVWTGFIWMRTGTSGRSL